jgi:hypothetical protein
MENDVRFGKAADQPLRAQVMNDGQLFSLRCRKHFESFAALEAGKSAESLRP